MQQHVNLYEKSANSGIQFMVVYYKSMEGITIEAKNYKYDNLCHIAATISVSMFRYIFEYGNELDR